MPRKQPTQPTLKSVAQDVAQLERDELMELQAIIDGLLEVPDLEGGTLQENEPAVEIDPENYQGSRGGHGYIEFKTINGCGPYRYLRYWKGSSLKSMYLGKASSNES